MLLVRVDLGRRVEEGGELERDEWKNDLSSSRNRSVLFGSSYSPGPSPPPCNPSCLPPMKPRACHPTMCLYSPPIRQKASGPSRRPVIHGYYLHEASMQ